ncbi:MAG: nucleoside diphosphate kinase regulator [Syntrophorhabdaceae bacterium]|nr:nucleoside diphosphate kinase regulator [Syntrophorhabdus sp.]MDD5007612.1 nucleoside diphosphate kinase regulator [Syntrophorhabdaceae bacterium]MDD5243456.1 nucleoside diphosphate kinase regulator [Syntrophorhabdaceae bacterium]
MKTREIYITEYDMEKLRAIIEIYGGNDNPYLENLEDELDKARVVDPKNIPDNVVTMNSIVRIKDLDTGEEKTFTLVFPGKTNITEKAVSILAPIGTALIGYREGDIIEWEVPAGTKRFQVMEVIYQPERLGNYDL